jgi:regulator of protease activity HflC (stomatin/prohibitin superfamily)
MWALAFIFVFSLVAWLSLGWLKTHPEGSKDAADQTVDRSGGEMTLFFSVIAIIITLLLTCQTMVPTNHRGLIQSFNTINPNRSYGPGFNLKWPWEKIIDVSMAFEDMTFVAAEGELSSIAATTKDGFQLDIPISVNWAINPDHVALVKSRLPGYYTDRQYVIIRSVVRDVVNTKTWQEIVFDRTKFAQELANAIKAATTSYYGGQGYGEVSDEIVRYGIITLRDVSPPAPIMAALLNIQAAPIEGRANASRVQLPAGITAENYAQILQAQAVTEAVKAGRPVTIVAGSGVGPVAVVAK